jgi:two-component system OmpR family response regulator
MDAPRVLIVDDEEDLVSALVERLNLRGFQAVGVTTGAQALEHLAGSPCDVVLLDLKMPGIGGLEVFRRIKEHRPSPEIVLLTGLGSTQDAERGMQLGAFDYLMKPVKIDHLVRVLNTAVTRSRERQPAGDQP